MVSFPLLIFFLPLVASWQDERTIETVTALMVDPKCPSIVAVFDSIGPVDQDVIDKFVTKQIYPVTLLEGFNSTLMMTSNDINRDNKEPLCQNLVIFGRESRKMLAQLYKEMKRRFYLSKAAIVTQCSDQEASQILTEISNEKVVLVQERISKTLQLFVWTANNQINVTAVQSDFKVNNETLSFHSKNLSGRRLIVGVLNNPPTILIDHFNGTKDIRGIEVSILKTLAKDLQFNFDYVEALPTEMWGNPVRVNNSLRFTGLLGMLVRKEADIAMGNFYQSSSRWAYVSFTTVHMISSESFLVPAPRPYAKWTAVFYSFTISVWIWTIVSSFFIVVMLRLVASFSFSQRRRRDPVFANWTFCCHFVLGNLLTVQMQPQSIFSNANRMFLIWWFFGVLILTTGYRSGLISYMTFPFTPPPIDTIQQLVDSPLKKVVFGEYSKDILKNTNSKIQKKLGEDLIPIYNLTEMYTLLDSTQDVAVQSDLDNLLYKAATMFPTTSTGPRVHLIKETILPVRAAFGLQKDSQLNYYFDGEIQRLFESGIIDYHKTRFAKKINDWNPEKADDKISFSLDSLQGAFYLLTFGIVLSTLVFTAEIAFNAYQHKRI